MEKSGAEERRPDNDEEPVDTAGSAGSSHHNAGQRRANECRPTQTDTCALAHTHAHTVMFCALTRGPEFSQSKGFHQKRGLGVQRGGEKCL